jgi:hypothetical protein
MFSNDIAAHSDNALAVQAFCEFVKRIFPEQYEYWRTFQPMARKVDYGEVYEQLLIELTERKMI